MSETVYQSGNTVKLTCVFKDFEGNKVDPLAVKIIIYDARYNKLMESSDVQRASEGTYQYLYETDPTLTRGSIVYEWSGDIDGTIALKREVLKLQFI